MAATTIESSAFQLAALRSERLRIVGLILVSIAVLAVAVPRALLAGSEAQVQMMPRLVALVAVLVAYESVMLLFVSRRIRVEREPPFGTWMLNVVIETAFPTAALMMLTHSEYMGPYRSLSAPAILVYYFFIVLSTLRLSPVLCVLTGVFSAAGHLAVTGYTFRQFPQFAETVGAFPLSIYVTYGVFFLFGGILAGAVARQIRVHVGAALREAESRKQVEQMEHDLGIARSIQQSLLPNTVPEVDGFEIAGWSQPADQTGGDYYDWQVLPDKRIAISLADVTGHGIGPALVTAVCRAYSRASFPSGRDIGTLLTRINELLVEDLPADRFVTFVVGVLDPRTARIELLSAGHGPLLLYTAHDERVQEFGAHDIPFGLEESVQYGPPQEIALEPGDILVLLTDGFFEWANDQGEQFGTERLGNAIRAAQALPPVQIISRLYNAVTEFSGGTEQMDDLTAVVVKRSPVQKQ